MSGDGNYFQFAQSMFSEFGIQFCRPMTSGRIASKATSFSDMVNTSAFAAEVCGGPGSPRFSLLTFLLAKKR